MSSRTLHKVFMQLKMTGFIEPSHSGTVICSASNDVLQRRPRIFLFSPTDRDFHADDPIIQTLIANIERYGFELVWCTFSQSETAAALEMLEPDEKDSVIFTNSTFSEGAGIFLQQRNIPFVSANRPAMGVDINWVDWNHLELFDDIIGTLVGYGARRIAFLHTGTGNHIHAHLPDNHWLIVDDFEAAKKSYLLFYPKHIEYSEELYCDIKMYVEYLLTLKHLPEVIWCGSLATKRKVAMELQRRGVDTNKMLLFFISYSPAEADDFFVVHTRRSLQNFSNKVWELLMFSRLHPESPCRGIKQHCEVVYSKAIKRIKFN